MTTVAGYPTATTITETGSLPSGVSFTDNGNGTATLAGTPASGTSGSYPLTFSATNTTGTRQQSFTLTVQPANSAPVITSADHATFAKGSAGSFTVTTTGFPTATITKTGTLPAGVTFTDNHNGTATIAGTPTATGAFTITITASNGVAPNATPDLHADRHRAAGDHQRQHRHVHLERRRPVVHGDHHADSRSRPSPRPARCRPA